MSWMKVDDRLHGHPKARRAGLAAMGLWVLAGSYCAGYVEPGREGFVPDHFVLSWPDGLVLAERLVRVGLWSPTEVEGEAGWLFHDWLDCNPSAEQEARKRALARDRQRQFRARQTGEPSVTERTTSRVTSRTTSRVSNATPIPNPNLREGGKVTHHVTRDAVVAAEPPLRCPAHRDAPASGPCGPCGDFRREHDAWARRPAPSKPEVRCPEHDLLHHGRCPSCVADALAAPLPQRGTRSA